ncbi:MAG TPA: universal stress protein [Candidatus Limnocylindria bacterium]|nr:universal stress protein [Candidatus Limnocylindria bacterium]
MRVMLAFDGSAGAEAARDLVAHLPWPAGTAITLVAALERGPDLFGAPDPGEADELLLADLQEGLLLAAAPLRASDRIIETRVVRGRPASALLDEAHAMQPDLIVIGSRGHGPLATVLVGSVSTEVVDHAGCPVLVARGPVVHRLVVGVDGSSSAQRAIATLSAWPIFAGLPARVVSVAEPPPGWAVSMGAAFYPAWVELRDSTLDARRGHLEQVAERACEDLAGVGLRPTVELREGDPAEELLRAALEDDADLIVTGSRGLSALPRLALGSVARKVLLHTRCSVLVVREPRERVRSEEPARVMPHLVGTPA